MAAVELTAGKLIAERYQLERLLGEGGMGAVWSAMHVMTKKRVALKFLKPNAASSPSHVRRFMREARAASAVRHPNVVEIHDIVALDDGAPVMVMDLLIGESLAERLARDHVLELSELSRLILPVISAVGTAHSLGIVHRDIKPDNVFLERSGDGTLVPRILDFGIAKLSAQEGAAAETASLTSTGSIMGTPYYMAPEQVFGERDIDQRADVWAFGVILYEALSGKRPIDGDNFGQLFKLIATGGIVPLDQVAPHLPRDITSLVARMLTRERELRPLDLREVFDTLRRYADVKAASFAGARPDLEALRDESSAAYAETQTPAPIGAMTPQQFYDGPGRTAVMQEPGGQAHTEEPVWRINGASRNKRSLLTWLGITFAALLLTLGVLSLLSRQQPNAAGSAAETAPSALPAASPSVAHQTEPTPSRMPPAPPSASASAPVAETASATPKKQKPATAGSAKATSVVAPVAPVTPPAAPAAPAATPAKLPGGIAPNAPF